MTLVNESDYDKVAEGEEILIEKFRSAVERENVAYLKTKSGELIPLSLSLSDRQREILLAGGMLNYTKNKG